MSHNVDGVEGQDSMYGSLTNSLIFPNTVQVPPIPQQGWQGPMGWQQNNGTMENGYTNFYQDHMMGAAPNYMYNEPELVAYDEGDEDFYENQQQWESHGESETQVDEHNNTKGIQETRLEAITTSSGATPVVPQPNARVGLPDTRKENQKPTDKNSRYGTSIAPSDRAAELRAKLLAKRSANETTPGPEPKLKKTTQVTELGATSTANGNKTESKLKANPDSGKGGVGISNKADGGQTASECFNRRDSSADIEGLFAEARAAVEAQTSAGHTDKKELNGGQKAVTPSAKKGSQSKPEIARRPSFNNSVKSLEASEQGEIREDTGDSGQARQPSEAQKPKQSETVGKVNPDKSGHPTATASNTAQRKKYINTDLANGVRDRPSPSSARTRQESISSRKASTDTQSQPKTATQRGQEDHSTHAERSSRPDRDLHVSPRDGERERERKAAEYKRELENRRQRSAGVRAAPDQDVEDPRRSRQNTVSDFKASETRANGKEAHVAQEPATENRNEDLEDWLQMTGYYDRAYRKRVLDRNRKLLALETQRAELEREAQVEYEERAQIARAQSVLPRESIERDTSRVMYSPKSLRTSSVTTMPPPPVPIKQNGDTVGLRIKDLAVREPSTSGRHIEDELRPVKHVDVLSPVEPPNLKRHHVSDDREFEELQPADKLVRLDMKGRAVPRAEIDHDRVPVRASSVSFERRMTLDDSEWSRNGFREYTSGNHEMERQPRQVRGPPVSPYTGVDRQRLRSLSPVQRRTSGQDTYMTDRRHSDDFNADRVSRSPGQVILSRDSSPPRRTQSIRYEGYRDEPPVRRYYGERIRAEPKYRANSEYQDHFPGRTYDNHQYVSNRGRGGFRGRGYFHSGRGGYKNFKREEEHAGNGFQSQSLDLGAGDSRFFLIKSWNYDNVVAAQRDETWVTQEKNLNILVDAFKTCRHVILAFSVNKSVAFQGYARMESLPGTVEKPAWARELHWSTSPPFRIRWITTAETHSSRVHHLKNSLNENQGVHVGRDGQEIEEQCGIALCDIMDEEERKMRLLDEPY